MPDGRNKQANEFSRRVLLCVAGMSPQIVTETLYAVLRRDPPFVPSEILIITTVPGAELAARALLHEPRVKRLLEESGQDPSTVLFTADQIHVPRDSDDKPLADLRSDADNAIMADAILRMVAQLTEQQDCAIHASIAGGRKTMGYYLGQIMSMIGRPQDRISHVLINEPFESQRDFFYPPRQPFSIKTSSGTVSSAEARIDLALIPFIRLRTRLSKQWLQTLSETSSLFSQAVDTAQLGIEKPRLNIDLENRTVEIGREQIFTVTMRPSALGLYTAAAARRKYEADDEKATIRRNALPLNVIDTILEHGELRRWTDDEDDSDQVRRLLAERNDSEEGRYYDRCANAVQAALLEAAGTEAPSIYGLIRYERGAFGLLGLKPDEIAIHWPSFNELSLDDLPWAADVQRGSA